MKIKTIDVNAKEWFDRVNGNSYFSGTVTVNFGMKDQKVFTMPFQYGYGDMYMQVARQKIWEFMFAPSYKNPTLSVDLNYPLSVYCRKHNIILRTHKQENCKKREVENV